MLDYLLRPVRFDYLSPFAKGRSGLRILDVGCGNGSASLTKKYFPDCIYHGIDKNRDLIPESECSFLEKFYEIDLDTGRLAVVADGWYDWVVASHVIEHLHSGVRVLEELSTKVRPGGILYIETPTERSLGFPSMPGTLNFHDDPTHVRVYTPDELLDVLKRRGFDILRSGVRRSAKRLLLFPFHLLWSLVRYREIRGTVFWDVMGFAAVIIARRRPE